MHLDCMCLLSWATRAWGCGRRLSNGRLLVFCQLSYRLFICMGVCLGCAMNMETALEIHQCNAVMDHCIASMDACECRPVVCPSLPVSRQASQPCMACTPPSWAPGFSACSSKSTPGSVHAGHGGASVHSASGACAASVPHLFLITSLSAT